MPIIPTHKADLLVALLRAKGPHANCKEQEWFNALKPFGYADTWKLISHARREGLLVRDYSRKDEEYLKLVDNKYEHHPVPLFYEVASSRDKRYPMAESNLWQKPKPKTVQSGGLDTPPIWEDERPQHPCVAAQVSYFRGPALSQVSPPPTLSPVKLSKHSDMTLAQLHSVITQAPPHLVTATEAVGLLHGSALAPFVAGTLDQVTFGGVWLPEQGLTTPSPLVAFVLTVEPTQLAVTSAHQVLLADEQLHDALLLLYYHEATHRLVSVLDGTLAPDVETAKAQYQEYFRGHSQLRGLQVAEPPTDELGRALCPVWSHPTAHLHSALRPPEAPTAEQP